VAELTTCVRVILGISKTAKRIKGMMSTAEAHQSSSPLAHTIPPPGCFGRLVFFDTTPSAKQSITLFDR
jgi:hypothetical protein